jgi:hypothetical protein
MFNIYMLPADHGDCLWVEYGKEGELHRVLIDGGTQHSYKILADRIKNHPDETLNFELFVITHVDADHIGGALTLFREIERLDRQIVFGDIWFNGWKHLADDRLGDMQGELVTNHLERRGLPWNRAFNGEAAAVSAMGSLPSHILPGGLRLTLLSPTAEKLNRLRLRWHKTITDAELELGAVDDKEKYFVKREDALGTREFPDVEALAGSVFKDDDAPANGSSIAFLTEYEDEDREKRCLFTGDAHVDVLAESIKSLINENGRNIKAGRLQIDALKVSHHGSKNNLSNELLSLLDCPNYLFSTNGQQFNHPDREAVARVIKNGRPINNSNPKLFFNYRSDFNQVWDESGIKSDFDYKTEYPEIGTEGLEVRL